MVSHILDRDRPLLHVKRIIYQCGALSIGHVRPTPAVAGEQLGRLSAAWQLPAQVCGRRRRRRARTFAMRCGHAARSLGRKGGRKNVVAAAAAKTTTYLKARKKEKR